MPRTLASAGIALILLSSSVLLFWRLSAEPFHDYDEATYTEVVAESAAHGEVLSFSYLNQPFFRKPPLPLWLMELSAKLPASAEFSLRFPGALAALLAVALVMLLAYEAYASVPAALLAGAVLATTGAFIEPARQVRFDIFVALFIMATFYAFLRAERDPRWYLAAGVCFGLAVLAKSVIAAFAVVAVLSYALARREYSWLKNPWVWGGALFALFVVLPWHLYETLRYGAAFWHSYIGTEVVDRVRENIFGSGTTAPQYFLYLFTQGAPWTEVFLGFLASLPFLFTHLSARARAVIIACVATVAGVLAVMLASSTKATTYLIPIYPFIALALASALVPRLDAKKRAALGTVFAASVAFALCLTAYNAFHANPYFSIVVGEGREEAAIGRLVAGYGPSATLYTYDVNDLGSIEYYSRIAFGRHPFVYLLSDTSVITPDSYVLVSKPETAIARFPLRHFTTVYRGAYMSLLRIDS